MPWPIILCTTGVDLNKEVDFFDINHILNTHVRLARMAKCYSYQLVIYYALTTLIFQCNSGNHILYVLIYQIH